MPFFLLNQVSVCTGDKETVSRPPEKPKVMEMWHREECTRTQHGNPAGTEPCALPRARRRLGLRRSAVGVGARQASAPSHRAHCPGEREGALESLTSSDPDSDLSVAVTAVVCGDKGFRCQR